MLGIQEHLELLRKAVLAFPTRFPELVPLTHADAEQDFFSNIAHLQLYRRSWAVQRLVKVCRLLRVGCMLSCLDRAVCYLPVIGRWQWLKHCRHNVLLLAL